MSHYSAPSILVMGYCPVGIDASGLSQSLKPAGAFPKKSLAALALQDLRDRVIDAAKQDGMSYGGRQCGAAIWMGFSP